jgi:hypothetical protein
MKFHACLVVLVLGCGGADQSSLNDEAGTQGIDGGLTDSSPAPESGNQQDVTVADVTGIKDVTTVPDVPVGPPDSQILCGPSVKCSAQSQICCHHTATAPEWQCVTDLTQCQGFADVPISCSGHDNCASQGTPGDVCCANVQSNGSCDVATDVSCMSTCDPTAGQVPVGCSSTDPCPTDAPNCKLSTCTLSGYYICTP